MNAEEIAGELVVRMHELKDDLDNVARGIIEEMSGCAAALGALGYEVPFEVPSVPSAGTQAAEVPNEPTEAVAAVSEAANEPTTRRRRPAAKRRGPLERRSTNGKAMTRAQQIEQLLVRWQPRSLTAREISDGTGIANSAVHQVLKALVASGDVRKDKKASPDGPAKYLLPDRKA